MGKQISRPTEKWANKCVQRQTKNVSAAWMDEQIETQSWLPLHACFYNYECSQTSNVPLKAANLRMQMYAIIAIHKLSNSLIII